MKKDIEFKNTNSVSIETTRVRMLYESVNDGSLTYYMLLVFVASIYLWDDNSVAQVVFFTLLTIIIRLCIQLNIRRLSHVDHDSIIPKTWENRMILSLFIEAFAISTIAMFMVNSKEPLMFYLIITVIIIGAAASSVYLLASIKTYYARIIGLFIPVSFELLMSEESLYWMMSGLVVFVVMPSLFRIGKKLHVSFLDTLQLRFENVELLAAAQEERACAEKANTDKSRFLAATSHDLRQPLHALDLFLGGLKNRLQEKDNVELLLQAQASSSALRELLNALLDVSRLDAGDVKMKKQVVPLTPVLQECCDEFLPVAKAKGLSFKLRPFLDIYINTDAILFARILRNLISNAIHYTKSGGILVAVRQRGTNIRIEIWDTGKGIDVKAQQHIFDEYYQIDNPERDSEKGLGLGLAIVRRISKLLEHPVYFHSRLGKGSCFHVTVPTAKPQNLTSSIEGNKHMDDSLSGLFVLVIDDHKLILEGMRGILRDWGCEVLCASSLYEILQEFKSYDYPIPDVMVIDYRLRGNETGEKAIDAIRAYFIAEIPAVLMTGEAHEVDKIVQNIDAKLIRKPVAAEELKSLLHQCMGH